MRVIRVMIVDDSAVVREVMQKMLKGYPDITVIGAAQDPIFALQRMRTNWPDVILLDIEMPRRAPSKMAWRRWRSSSTCAAWAQSSICTPSVTSCLR